MSTQTISSGVTSSGLVISGADAQGANTLVVLSGGSIVNTTVLTTLTVSSGGTARDTDLRASATMWRSWVNALIDGVTTGTTVETGGVETVESDGVVIGSTVESGGVELVSSGGQASATSVTNGGVEILETGAIASGVTVSSGGSVELSEVFRSGQTTIPSEIVSDTTVISGVTILSGGFVTALNITVLSGATLDIPYSERVLSGEVVSAGGTISGSPGELDGEGYDAGAISGVYIGGANPGTLEVQSGGSLVSSTLIYGEIIVDAGGTITGTRISAGGVDIYGVAVGDSGAKSEFVESGGIAIGTMLSGGFSFQNVFTGGVASDTVVGNNGLQFLESGAAAYGTVVSSGGQLSVLGGATASGVTVSSGGLADLADAVITNSVTLAITSGVATSPLMLSGVTIESGGTLVTNSATVLSGGVLTIPAGASPILYAPTIDLWVSSGAALNGPGSLQGDVYVAGAVSGLTVTGGGQTTALFVESGATATDVVAGSDAVVVVSSGGVASETVISSGGTLAVMPDGVADGVQIVSGAALQVSSGATANQTVVSSGGIETISGGGTASNTSVQFGGALVVRPGGDVSGGNVSSGGSVYQLVDSGGESTFGPGDSGVVDGLTLQSGALLSNLEVASGASINGFEVAADSIESVDAGGEALTTTIDAQGSATISSGGLASGLVVSSGGFLVIQSGGNAENITVESGGDVFLFPGGSANGVVSGGGVASLLAVSSGVTAFGPGDVAVVDGLTLESGARLPGLAVNLGAETSAFVVNSGGSEQIYAGGESLATTIDGQGSETVAGGGLASGTVISSGGLLILQSGAVAQSTVINPGAALTVYSGQTANQTLVSSGGTETLSSGSVASGTAIEAGGDLILSPDVNVSGGLVASGGSVSGLILSGGLAVFGAGDAGIVDGLTLQSGVLLAGLEVASGATTSGFFIASGGLQELDSGGASVATVIGAGGAEGVGTGAIASGTIVNSGGFLDISWGASAIGSNVQSGGSMYLGGGGTLSATTLNVGAGLRVQDVVATSAYVNGSGQLVLTSSGAAVDSISLAGAAGNLGFIVTPPTAWQVQYEAVYETVITVVSAPQPVEAFDHAGLSDLLWRNSNGEAGVWLTTSGGGYNAVDFGIVSPSWSIQQAADFNGDGKADILWRNANGELGVWLSNGGSGYAGDTSLDLGLVPTSWTIDGAGDFNGDGKADILWRNSNGDAGVWLSNAGAGYTGFTSIDFGVVASSWTIQGVGDFNGDGKADILWRNSNGDVGVWLSNAGAGYTGFTSIDFGVVPSSWSIAGVGDFNGDGKTDILWRNSNGDAGVWLSNSGSGYAGFTSVDFGVVPAGWSIEGVGDYNGDGKADILWRNSNGDTGEWLSNAGSGYAGFTSTDLGVVPAAWQIVDTTAPPASPSTALFTQAMASIIDPGAAAISTQGPATQASAQSALAVLHKA